MSWTMKACLGRSMILATSLWAMAGATLAHHSFAMFDQTKQVKLDGVISDFQWTNPHAWLHVQVTNGTEKTVWQVELNSPNNLKRQGWRSDIVKPGDNVKVVINPLRDGSKGGLFVAMTLADGKVLGDPNQGRSGPINVPSTP